MKMNKFLKVRFFLFVISLLSFMVISVLADRPLHASIWDDIKTKILLEKLPGKGEFIASEHNVHMKDPNFPLEVVSDGYKMVRIFQNLMDDYIVEWAWKVTLKNKTMKEINFSLEYKLQDKDSFFVVSSQEQFKKIAPGGTLTIEKIDQLPYEKARQVTTRTLDIQLQK